MRAVITATNHTYVPLCCGSSLLSLVQKLLTPVLAVKNPLDIPAKILNIPPNRHSPKPAGTACLLVQQRTCANNGFPVVHCYVLGQMGRCEAAAWRTAAAGAPALMWRSRCSCHQHQPSDLPEEAG